MTKENLLTMNFGEELWADGSGILRVFNGWVYLFYDKQTDTITSSVFVPEKLNCKQGF